MTRFPADFELGFWHPFGPYMDRSVDVILALKGGEAERCGWTLWSFASCDLMAWHQQLIGIAGPVYVLCSDSPGARDPDLYGRDERHAQAYQLVGSDVWQEMPDRELMIATNPFKRRERACAYVVRKVIQIVAADVPPIKIEWYGKDKGEWSRERLPTRGEFMIRRGGEQPLRRVRAVLELAPPYLAVLRPMPRTP